MEFGALRVREWRQDVSHIVVDEHVPYQDVIKFLKISSLPVRQWLRSLSALDLC